MKCLNLNKVVGLLVVVGFMFAFALPAKIMRYRPNGQKAMVRSVRDGYPTCGSPLLANESNFTMQEVYESDQIEVKIGDVQIGLSCGVSVDASGENTYLTGMQDYGAGIYDADSDGPTFVSRFKVGGFCDDSLDGHVRHPIIGNINAIPSPDSVTRQLLDYWLYDGKIQARVYAKDNLDNHMIFRDANQNIIALANRAGTEWRVHNPKNLSSVFIAFVLTHKLNKNAQCWISANEGGAGPLGFWPSIAVAVGVTSLVSSATAVMITLACYKTYLRKQPAQYQLVHVLGPMDVK